MLTKYQVSHGGLVGLKLYEINKLLNIQKQNNYLIK